MVVNCHKTPKIKWKNTEKQAKAAKRIVKKCIVKGTVH